MQAMEAVCLVEDDPLVRDALLFSLRDNDFEVEVASDGESGLALVGAGRFDYVVTDINMAKGGGLKLIESVRMDHPHIPIIAMTGGGQRDGVPLSELARRAGADICLSKPFRPSELLKALGAAKSAREGAATGGMR